MNEKIFITQVGGSAIALCEEKKREVNDVARRNKSKGGILCVSGE